MAIYTNLAGTTSNAFRIGKGGVTLAQGTSDPNATAIGGTNGDIYVQVGGTSPRFFQFVQNAWVQLNVDQTFVRRLVAQASYTAKNSDLYLGINYAGTVDIFLPLGVANKRFIFKDESGAASNNMITVHAFSGQTIDGSATLNINVNYSSITIVYGAEWHVM